MRDAMYRISVVAFGIGTEEVAILGGGEVVFLLEESGEGAADGEAGC